MRKNGDTMKQYFFSGYEFSQFDEIIAKIKSFEEYSENRPMLMQVSEPTCNKSFAQFSIDLFKIHLPNVDLVGMTGHCALTEDTTARGYAVGSLIIFDEATYDIADYDCHDMSPEDAAMQYIEHLKTLQNVKGIQVFSSDITLCPGPFVDMLSDAYPKVPIFGALAGTANMYEDRSLIYGNAKVLDRGIVAIAYMGENLHIKTDYNLGWRKLGREFTVTKSDEDGVVYEIDGEKAMNVYTKYLGIKPNKYFFENTSAFPFMLRKGNVDVTRVTLGYSDDGSISFAMKIPAGTTMSLSYAKSDYLLEEVLDNANKLIKFAPQALLMFACMNRRVLMGDELADKELNYYLNVVPNGFWLNGYGEILRNINGGGLLNSALVAVSMREGEKKAITATPILEDTDAKKSETPIVPLSDRLVSFLEATTNDLNMSLNDLYVKASVDVLTNLFNRRSLDEFVDLAIKDAKTGKNVSVMLFDIDHFKNVNDTYGHDVGDIVLKKLANIIKALVKNDSGAVGRWGGEEFLCLLKDIDLASAVEFAEHVRKNVEVMKFGPVPKVTISIGVTQIRSDDTPETLFSRVDSLLYAAKENGRNRVEYKSKNGDT